MSQTSHLTQSTHFSNGMSFAFILSEQRKSFEANVIDLCLHVANVFYLVSFLARDILWLRVLTCAGLVLGLGFFTCGPAPLYGPAMWHGVFLIINAIQISRLVTERRELMLSLEEERIGEANFRHLSRAELLTALARVMCKKPQTGRELERLCHQPLTKEERVLRDIAFTRLARHELLNLLTRRLWNSLKDRNPLWWKRRHRPGAGTCAPAEATAVLR